MRLFISFILPVLMTLNTFSANFSRTILPYSDNSDFTYEGMKGWKISGLTILGGDAINDGFSIKVDFTTPGNLCNAPIFTIGAMVGTQFFKAFSLTEANSNLKLQREVIVGSQLKTHHVEAWTKDLIQKGTNYTLFLEMDETRCRYSIWETGQESSKKYEYEFYGLAKSCVKDILSQPNAVFSIAASTTTFRVQKIYIETLGTGVGVQVPDPKTDVTFVRLRNQNSNKYMTLFNGVIADKNYMVQYPMTVGGSSVYKLVPIYQSSRTPLGYMAQLVNLSSNMPISINNCSVYNLSYVINTPSSNCQIWHMDREQVRSGFFKMRNLSTNTFAVVKDASLLDNMPIVTWESAYTNNSFWAYERVAFHRSIETGTYLIKNKNSSLYASPALLSYDSKTVVQYPQSYYGNMVWYIKKDDMGLYSIQNVDSKKYLVTQDASLAENANIIQDEKVGAGNTKWIISEQSQSGLYTIQNVHSDKYMQVNGASTASGAGIVQKSTGGDEKSWDLIPYTFPVPHNISGLFKLKNIYTNLYLSVRADSKSSSAKLESCKTVSKPSGWWSFVKMEDGGYAIKNVNSQCFINVAGASTEENAPVIQYHMNPGTYKGNSLWQLEPDNLGIQNIYWIRNIHSGKFLYFSGIEYKDGIPAIQVSSDHNLMHRWLLEPVVIE